MPRTPLPALAAALALTGVAQAAPAPAPAGARTATVTIYNNDLALVDETRTLDVAAGRQRLEFKDVSAAIRPETVSLAAPGLAIVEQNFDFDLLTPSKLMEKAVGQQVRIVRTNPGDGKETTEVATVLSVNDGVVLRIGDRIEVLRDDGAPTRVIFDKIPDNLRANPTLSVTVDADKAGPRQSRLSYLTTGLSWKADYVALFDEKKGALDLQGWITLTNRAGSGFTDVATQLVAGNVGQQYTRPAPPIRNVRAAGAEVSDQATVGENYLYTLPQRTTIADNQTKQVSFLDAKGVSAARVYLYRGSGFVTDERPQHVDVAVTFANSRAKGLGAPLPAGTLRIYMRDDAGEAKFVGENAISHTPQGSELSVKMGEAFDVTVQPTLTATDKLTKTKTRYAMTYLVRNARPEAVKVQVEQPVYGRDTKVTKESLPSRKLDANRFAWDVPVPAGGETTLTFEVESDQ